MDKHVLVIENEPQIARLVSLHLEDLGCRVEVVGTAAAGLARLRVRRSDPPGCGLTIRHEKHLYSPHHGSPRPAHGGGGGHSGGHSGDEPPLRSAGSARAQPRARPGAGGGAATPRPWRGAARGARLPIFGDDPRSPQGRKVFSVAPVEAGDGHRTGYLYVILSGEKAASVASLVRTSHIVRLGLATAAGCVLLALLGGGLLFRRLTRRLRALARQVGDFGARQLAPAMSSGADGGRRAGAPGTPVRPGPGDEIDQLRGTFSRMAERIEEQDAATWDWRNPVAKVTVSRVGL